VQYWYITEKIRFSANPTQGPRFCEKNELGSQGSSLQRLGTNRIWTPRLTGEGNQWGRTQTRVAANPLHTVEKQPRHTSHIVNFAQNASTRTIHDLTKGFAPSTNSRPTVVAASHVHTALPKLQNKSATLPGPQADSDPAKSPSHTHTHTRRNSPEAHSGPLRVKTLLRASLDSGRTHPPGHFGNPLFLKKNTKVSCLVFFQSTIPGNIRAPDLKKRVATGILKRNGCSAKKGGFGRERV
jgi:hypothetical protein